MTLCRPASVLTPIYGHSAVPEDDESLKEIIFRALPNKTRERVQEKMEMRSTSTLDVNIGNFDFGWIKETCRQVESELRAREYRYRSRALNSLQIEGREEVIATDTVDPPLAADTSTLHYAGDRYSRSTSQPGRMPPRFGSPRDKRGRSPSVKPRIAARRPGDPIPLRSRSPLATRARAHAILPYDPVKNADACFNCGNTGHQTRECKHPKDDTRIRANLESLRKHRSQLVAKVNVMNAALSQELDNPSPEKSEDEGSDFHLHTGDTTEAEEETDIDDTEDEGSDLEHDHEDEDRDRAKDHHP